MRSSRGEIKIEDILNAAGLDFIEEYSFPDLYAPSGRALRFDFAVFDDAGELDFLIEYQGAQHYMPKPKFGGALGFHQQQYNDNLKREYCRKHGYKLIEIPYTDIDIVTYDYIMKMAGLF